MSTKGVVGVLVIIAFAIKSVRLDDMSALQNEIMDSNYNGAIGSTGGGNSGVDQMIYGGNRMEVNNKNQNIENLAEPPRQTWLDTARNALSGPTGQIVVHMAKEMISRSTGNSQILSLNLTNLLILILLKALIFAAGLIGAGNWGQYGRARSIDSPFLLPEEAPLFIGYLALEGSGQDGCLNQAACKAPDTAQEYLKAAMAVIKGTEMFDKNFMNTTKKNYSYMLNQLEHSIQRGIEGAACDSIYHCHL